MSTEPHVPVSPEQRQLLARLVAQNRVSVDKLRAANVGAMSRRELAQWIDAEVLGTQASEKVRSDIDALFEADATEPPAPGSVKA